MFDLEIEGMDEWLDKLDDLDDLLSKSIFQEALIDAAIIVEARAKDYLLKFIYDTPERGYSRKMGAGLFGKTFATKKVKKQKTQIQTAVGSFIFYAPYVHYGTGIFAQDGKGRKTPWIYEDANGRFHKTVGQKPKPYLVNALMDSKDDIMAVLAEGLQEVISSKNI